MQSRHLPTIDARYWAGITAASVLGTNLGDLYAHASGLGLDKGLGVLFAMAIAAFAAERFDARTHQIYYWGVILIIRTGATNIADFLAYQAHVPPAALIAALVTIIAGAAFLGQLGSKEPRRGDAHLPDTDALYWIAMLAAGVFGTVAGDLCEHVFGEGLASVGLAWVLAVALFLARGRAHLAVVYWSTVGVARTTGTALGDWLADTKSLPLGLPGATLATAVLFLAMLALWRSRGPAPAPAAAPGGARN